MTGADGFTGLHFAKAAKAAGHEVIEFTANLTDRVATKLQVELAVPQAVVHLAAISFVGHENASAFYDVNVVGTLNLLDALQELPILPSSVLLASSANVYGNCDQSPITEMQAPVPVNHYAMSKLAMEYLAKTYMAKLPLFFVRPFNYTGQGQVASFVVPKIVAHFKQQAKSIELGNLHVEREYNDVRTVCAAYLALLEKAKAGETYNICSGQTYTLQYVIEQLTQLTGLTMDVTVNPAFVRANEVHRLCGDPTKLLDAIGPLKAPMLAETLQWMLDC